MQVIDFTVCPKCGRKRVLPLKEENMVRCTWCKWTGVLEVKDASGERNS